MVPGRHTLGPGHEGQQQVELATRDVDDLAAWGPQDARSRLQPPSVELVGKWKVVGVRRDLGGATQDGLEVIPAKILALPTPDDGEARRALVERAARALGIATAPELRDYFRLGPDDAKSAIEIFVEAGILQPVEVPGWARLAYLHRDARLPRRLSARALLAPFDPLVWERSRTLRLFGFHYRIEIYTPADKRQHGYYVLPFLLGDRLVARLDLKTDRQSGQLLVHAMHSEPHAPSDAMDAIVEELAGLANWLGLARVIMPSGPAPRSTG